MTDFRRLSESVWASPQVDSDDIAEAAAQGFTLIVNNRPDGEDAQQPGGAAIAAAARNAGMDYVAIPIDHSGMSEEHIAAMRDALSALPADGKALAYCRSGTRSTFLWSLAEASRGGDPDAIVEAAAQAGYDVQAMRPTLQSLAEKARG